MTIVLALAGGALLVRLFAWPVLRQRLHNIPDEHELWPHGADEPVDDYLARVVPLPGSNLDTCQRILAATEAAERARREHPSSRGDA